MVDISSKHAIFTKNIVHDVKNQLAYSVRPSTHKIFITIFQLTHFLIFATKMTNLSIHVHSLVFQIYQQKSDNTFNSTHPSKTTQKTEKSNKNTKCHHIRTRSLRKRYKFCSSQHKVQTKKVLKQETYHHKEKQQFNNIHVQNIHIKNSIHTCLFSITKS